MQAKWGTHGDHPVIAISPSSVPEFFNLTIRAFNLAEKYRTPVILLADEVVAHMREKVELPNPNEIEIYNRIKPENGEDYVAYRVEDGDIVPKMASFGKGYRYHVTGLFHDETGFPSNSTDNAGFMLNRIMNKITDNLDDIIEYDEYMVEDAETLIVSYGSTARTAKSAVKTLRKEGIKVGLFRPITLWPSPEDRLVELGKQVKNIFVIEMNLGQYVQEVERIIKSNAVVQHVGRANGEIMTPSEIVDALKEVK